MTCVFYFFKLPREWCRYFAIGLPIGLDELKGNARARAASRRLAGKHACRGKGYLVLQVFAHGLEERRWYYASRAPPPDVKLLAGERSIAGVERDPKDISNAHVFGPTREARLAGLFRQLRQLYDCAVVRS